MKKLLAIVTLFVLSFSTTSFTNPDQDLIDDGWYLSDCYCIGGGCTQVYEKVETRYRIGFQGGILGIWPDGVYVLGAVRDVDSCN